MIDTDRPCTFFDVRDGEVHEIVDEEYRYRGETRHRQHPTTKHTACCMNCGWNVIEARFMDVRAKARAHVRQQDREVCR